MDEERLAYLTLTQVPGMGPGRLKALLSAFPSAIGAYSAPFDFLGTLAGFSCALATATKATSLDVGRKVVEEAHRLGAGILIPADEFYPALLRHIADPPPVLFTLGDQSLLDTARCRHRWQQRSLQLRCGGLPLGCRRRSRRRRDRRQRHGSRSRCGGPGCGSRCRWLYHRRAR